jgi:lipoprotein-releasing system permease protein
MSVMNGFHKELLDKIVGVNGHIFLQAADTPLTDFDRVVTDVKRVKGVQLVIPMVEGAAGVSSPFNQAGALVRGVKEADLKELPGIAGHVKIGTLDGFDTAGGVAIGQGLAESLSLRVGDNITILTAKGAQTPFGVAPRIKSYPVTAIFQIGMAQFDNLFVYMPLPEAQAFFNKDGEATVIELFLKNPEQIDAVRSDVDLAVPRPMIMTDWRERNKTFFDALKVERNVMFIIVTLIVLVAALNIISGLIMLVKDKSADIAILRTMGAPRGSIMRIFLITGTAIGVSGTLAGFVLGLVIAENIEAIRSGLNELLHTNLFPAEIYFLSRLPSVVEPSDVITVVVMTLSLSVLATLYPSWRAARLDPVEALRYG